jgi:hypothetical protein
MLSFLALVAPLAMAAAAPPIPSLNAFFDIRDEIDLGFSHLLTNEYQSAFSAFTLIGSNLSRLEARIAAMPDRPLGDVAKVTNKFPIIQPGDNPVVYCRKQLSIAANAYLAGLYALSARSISNVGVKIEEARDYTATHLFRKQAAPQPDLAELREMLLRLSNSFQALQLTNRLDPVAREAQPDTNPALTSFLAVVSNEAQRNAETLRKLALDLAEVDTRLARMSNAFTISRLPSGMLSNLLVTSFQNLRNDDSANQALLENLRDLVARQQFQIEELAHRPPPTMTAAPVVVTQTPGATERQRRIEENFIELDAKLRILLKEMETYLSRQNAVAPRSRDDGGLRAQGASNHTDPSGNKTRVPATALAIAGGILFACFLALLWWRRRARRPEQRVDIQYLRKYIEKENTFPADEPRRREK